MFQSSPDPRVGCYSVPSMIALPLTCFNPHPTLGSGATVLLEHLIFLLIARNFGRTPAFCSDLHLLLPRAE
jgi:hypothetical protein